MKAIEVRENCRKNNGMYLQKYLYLASYYPLQPNLV